MDQSKTDTGSLKKKAVNAIKWTALERILFQVLRFSMVVFLARLLSPEDFGMVAISMFFVTVAESFVRLGFPQAYIRADDIDSEPYYVAISILSLLSATLLFFVLILLSKPVAHYYQLQELENIITLLSACLFIDAVCAPIQAKLEKTFKFRTIFHASLFSLFGSMIIALIIAKLGGEYWAILIQIVSQKLLLMGALLTKNRVQYFPLPSVSTFKDVYSFSWKLQLGAVFTTSSRELNALVIGQSVSVGAVGLFNRANAFQRLFVKTVVMIIEKVSYPSLSKFKNDREQLIYWTRRSTQLFSFVIFPGSALLFLCATEIIVVFLGEQWREAGEMLKILSFIGAVRFLQSSNLTILKVLGRTDVTLWIYIIELVVVVMFVGIGSFYGLMGIVIGYTSSVYAMYVIVMLMSQPISGYYLKDQLRDIAPYLFIVVLSTVITQLLIVFLGLSGIQKIIVTGTVIAASTVLIGYFFSLVESKYIFKWISNRYFSKKTTQ